jgi:acetyl-CoA carboxylase biotin carboxylase subunit
VIAKLLIANRGEVAVRIARACREMGVGTVGVVSDADVNAFHARSVDRVVWVGAAPSSESYLVGDRVIEAALSTGCDAIHPGYGFLSQNAEFAEAVEKAGLIWIGPPASAMRLMGDKLAARSSMIAAGVPVVPGFQGDGDETIDDLERGAAEVGWPLLVKAVAGGGGKGMRIVRKQSELRAALESASRESLKAFGDGRVFIERFVEEARHIEVQVLADNHGHCVHLFERECSLQRRYQKIIEESPSPLLDDDLRKRICSTAVAAAKACGYVSAGTVEFLVSSANRSFYFLEMNTRLQVEHPVTEAVTGVDIVRTQIEIAAGAPLPFEQSDLSIRGHAIECRIYAEDPAQNFAPASGTAHWVAFPAGPGIRVDAGLESGDEVSIYYDPLLAKLIVYADDRNSAIARMEAALSQTFVLGVTTNTAFLRDLLEHPDFVAGDVTTRFVETKMSDWSQDTTVSDDALIAAALFQLLSPHAASDRSRIGDDGDTYSPWDRTDGFRLGGR